MTFHKVLVQPLAILAAIFSTSHFQSVRAQDSTNKAFRVKDADGNWGPIENSKMTWNPNPQGLFEGSTKDWAVFMCQYQEL